ncbi:MAG: PDZ domain-containing protein [Fimbriimonadaceae bacterium]
MLLLAIGAHAENFSAKVTAISEANARSLCGYGAAGVAIDSAENGGLAVFLGLRARDVVLEVNGVRTTRPEDIARSVRPRSEQNTVTYARDGRKWTITVAATVSLRVAFVLPPDIVDDPDDPWVKIGTATGLNAEFLSSIPKDLSRFAVIVLASDRAAKPELVPALRRFLSKGGGVVLLGTVPESLCGGSAQVRDAWGGHTNAIADWFGTGVLDYAYRGGLDGADLAVRTNRPLATEFTVGQKVFAYVGVQPGLFAWGDKLVDTAVPVATWTWAREDNETQTRQPVGAFYNRYGDGRVYWQYESLSPNQPSLQELLVAAIRWAANAPSSR